MVGERFGRWTLLAPRDGRRVECRCDCGAARLVVFADLAGGRSKSCGCLAREVTAERSRTANRKHGMERSSEYRIWVDMRRRCHNPSRPDFKNYGARGIRVCDAWFNDFTAFFRDMGPRPAEHTLDRIDNTKGYCPSNCRWSPRTTQERNKRTNRRLTVRGEEMTMAEAAERFNIGYMTLANRINALGWDHERAVMTPPRARR